MISILFLLQGESFFGITWATLCNNQEECSDGSDEWDCKFSVWLIPSLVCGAAIFLSLALSFYILRQIRKVSNEILQDRQWRLVTSQLIDKKVAKLFKIERGIIENLTCQLWKKMNCFSPQITHAIYQLQAWLLLRFAIIHLASLEFPKVYRY